MTLPDPVNRTPVSGPGGPAERSPVDDRVFVTKRLVVRRWRDTDLDVLLEVYGDADAMRWVGDGTPLSRDDVVRWFTVTRENYAKRGYGMFAIESTSSPAIVGFCGIVHPGGQAEPEIKYALRRECRGRGYASEAATGLIAYGASTHGLHSISATTAPGNHASHRVLQKAGMRRGECVHHDDGSETQWFHWTRDGRAT